MQVLFSNIPPVHLPSQEATFIHAFRRLLADADRLEIAVGTATLASLEELQRFAKTHRLHSIKLLLGMYGRTGLSERLLRCCQRLHQEWMTEGVGEIRLMKPSLAFHGKTYAFYREDQLFAVLIGSADLSVLRPDAPTLRQFEVAVESSDPAVCANIATLFHELHAQSVPLTEADLKTFADPNFALECDDAASRLASSDFAVFQKNVIGPEFALPLSEAGLNVCCTASEDRQPRDWFEIDLRMTAEVCRQPGFPASDTPFLVATDDGYLFKVHVTEDKRLVSSNDPLTLGRWLKGRFVYSGFVKPGAPQEASRDHQITEAMLDEYGSHCIALQKTTHQRLAPNPSEGDGDGPYDLWVLQFKPDSERHAHES